VETYFGDRSKTGDRFLLDLGRFGPWEVGTVEDEGKPLFAACLPDQSLIVFSYEEAMDLCFKIARSLEFMKGEVRGQCGRFGPLY